MKGARRPPLKALLDQADVTWASVSVAWYDGTTRTVELTLTKPLSPKHRSTFSQTEIWYRSGKPPVIIRWVLIRDPQGAFAPQALLCTDQTVAPTQILEWFVEDRPFAKSTLQMFRAQCAGNWRSPFRRCEPTWAWRPSASGPTWPSPAPRRSCWGLLLLDHPEPPERRC